MDLPIQWLERYGLLHGKKVSSVNATVCIVACLTHKFGLCVKLLVTLTYQGYIVYSSEGKHISKVMARVLHLSAPH